MADNVWDNSDADNDGNVAANWSLGWVPKAGDVAVFDSGTTDANCTFSGAISCDGMRFDNVYAGTVDANGQTFTIGTGGLDCTGGGSATLTMGASTWTTSGQWDHQDLSAFNKDTSTVVVNADVNVSGTASGHAFNNLTINNTKTATVLNATLYVDGVLDVIGTITSGKHIFVSGTGELKLRSTGTILMPGNDYLAFYEIETGGGFTVFEAGGTLTIALALGLLIRPKDGNTCTMSAGDYSGVSGIRCYEIGTVDWGGGAYTFNDFTANTGDAGTLLLDFDSTTSVTVEGDFLIDSTGGGTTIQFDMGGGACNWIFQGNVTITETAGTVTWTKGTGSITFSGAANQDVDFNGKAVEDITINKSAGDFVLTGAVQTDSFTGTSTGTGDFDPNGQTITIDGNCDWAAAFLFDAASTCMDGSDWQIGGNFTADGQTLEADNGWDMDVTGTAVASGTGEVSHCTAGGTEIDASAGPWTDSGNNTNWNFGAVAAHRKAYILGGGICA